MKRQKLDRFPKKSVKTRSFVSPITTTTIVFFLLLVFFSVEFCLCHWLPWHCADYHDKRRHIKIPLLPFQPSTRQKKSKLASFITSILSRSQRQLNFFFKKKIKKASLLIVFSLKLFFFTSFISPEPLKKFCVEFQINKQSLLDDELQAFVPFFFFVSLSNNYRRKKKREYNKVF